MTASAGARSRRWSELLAIAVATVVVGGPALFTRDGFMYAPTTCGSSGVQGDAIAAHLRPTYFIHAPEAGGVSTRSSRSTAGPRMLPAAP